MTTNFDLQGGEILVGLSAGDKIVTDIIPLSSGGFVVIWSDYDVIPFSDGNGGIKAQLFDADGEQIGSEFVVTTTRAPAAATALQSGEFVISWVDWLGGTTDVKFQRFSAEGIAIGGEVLVDTPSAFEQIESEITALASGGFVVTWTDSTSISDEGDWTSNVAGQVFDADGAKVGSEFVLDAVPGPVSLNASVAGLASGDFVVVWEDPSGLGGDDSPPAVKAQLFASNAAKVGTEFLVNTTAIGSQGDPAVVSLASGGFVVTWTDSIEEGLSLISSGVKARIFDEDGNPSGPEFLVNSTVSGPQMDADVIPLTSGGFLATWTDESYFGPEGGPPGIKAQQFDASGQKIGVEFLVNTDIEDVQHNPFVTALAGGGFAISWMSSNAYTDAIKAQVFAPTSLGPSDISLSTSDVSEISVENLAVAVIASDGPITASLTYSILSDSTGGAFGIEGDKLIVVDNGKLDFDTAPSATIAIRATDNLGNHYDEELIVNVTDAINEVRLTAEDTFTANTTQTGPQYHSSVAKLASGGFVVTWTDVIGFAGANIRAQMFDPQGNAIGDEFLVNVPGAGTREASTVAASDAGGFLVCWTGDGAGGDGSGSAIKGQLFDADGNKVGVEFLVNTATQGGQFYPTAVALESGGYVVAWTDQSHVGGDDAAEAIKAQILDATGAKVGSEFLVNTTTASSQNGAKITSLDSGGFVVTWVDSSNGNQNVRAQAFSAAGDKIGSEILVNTTVDSDQLYPFITSLASGKFVIAWTDYSGPFGTGAVVKAQIFDGDGAKIGTEIAVGFPLDEKIYGVVGITLLSTGGFQITSSYFDNKSIILSQIFDENGQKVTSPFFFNEGLGADTAAAPTDDGFVVAFTNSVVSEGAEDSARIDVRLFHLADDRIGTFGIDTLNGDGADNGIYGFAGNDTMNGAAGKDRLDGGTGADAMSGGADDDIYVVDNAGDTVTENEDEGTDTVETSLGGGSTLAERQAAQYQLGANVENLVGTLDTGQGLRGNDLDNVVTGDDGADYVNASDGGSDTVNTNDGRDVIYYGAALTSADSNNAGDEGGDVRGDLLVIQGNYDITLGADALIDVEKFRIQKGEFTGWGDTAGNLCSYDITTVDANVAAGLRVVVQGGSLQLGEHLRFDGSAETDGSFQMFGGHDSDELIGGAQFDHLLGRSGDDTLTGNGGDDRLRGGLGADEMNGESGADIFVYAAQGGAEPYANAVLESTGFNHDTIIGFNFAEDKIDLPGSVSGLASVTTGALNNASFDANLATAVDSALAANGAVLFTANSGDQTGNTFLVVDADGNGSYQANLDFVIELQSWTGSTPTSPDFFM